MARMTVAQRKQALRGLGVHNDPEYAAKATAALGGRQRPFLAWISAPGGLSPLPSRWQVHRPGFKTDPDAHWSDCGRKAFSSYSHGGKAPALEAAKAWAGDRYGVSAWARSPFGGWHPAEVVAWWDAQLAGGQ